ncbi:SDR family NAD(P)-dependent oxidoreductase [Bacillus sp. OK048]|uniref:SDR family NAD(P)-dependent oxidoreductase n=1 Tax=Bacillus sp. OK048 TaxID=1882761 RepID=UPI00088436F8|nr:SDR family oxidoreductase [Bacillus sp. OK048]SDN31147.1 3-oxoacyl-[acyl-carrier protein] reductase [Bacillus sp. OK048]
MRLKNKVAVISAGASGMGRAGALLFAKEGAVVNILDINQESGQQVEKEIRENGWKANFLHTDMTNLSGINAAIEEIKMEYQRIDVLWNHVGVPGPPGIEEVEEKDFDLAMTLNLKSSFFTTQYALPLMKEAGGSIIFTASIGGLVASPFSPVYSAAKGAIVNLVRSLAVRLGNDQIRVNAICPGLTDTPMLKQFLTRTPEDDFEQNKRLMLDNIPLGRAAQPIDIANTALFLASDDSAFISGVNLAVDGGYTAK